MSIIDIIRRGKKIKLFIFIGIPMIYLTIFFFIPFLIAFLYSLGMFKQVVYQYVFVPEPSLEYYSGLMKFPGIFKSIQRSFYYATLTTIGTFLISYPLAYYIGVKLEERYRDLAVLVIFTPFWINFLLRVYAMRFILHEAGMINLILRLIGIISEPIKFLGTDTAVIIVMIYSYLIFMVLPLYGVLEKLDVELLEAAATLGATPFKAFIKITLPLSLPGILAGSLLVFIPAVGEFVIPELVGGPNTTTLGTIIYSFFLRVRGVTGWGIGSAAALIYIVMILVASYVYMKFVGGEVRLG